MYELIFFLFIVFIFYIIFQEIITQMVLVIAGIISGLVFSSQINLGNQFNFVLLIAELALVLFSDAFRIGLSYTIHEHNIPLRLLGIGMPLTIFSGIIFAAILLTNLSIWEAAIIGTLLAPTDAALGKTVFENKKLHA